MIMQWIVKGVKDKQNRHRHVGMVQKKRGTIMSLVHCSLNPVSTTISAMSPMKIACQIFVFRGEHVIFS